MDNDNKDIIDSLQYVLVRIDDTQEDTFAQVRAKGFVMVNVDMDSDQIPYALFVKENIMRSPKPEVVEHFMTYIVDNVMRNKIISEEHPIAWIGRMRTEYPKKGYTLIFFDEIYETIENVDMLRY